ncbi:MAG: hypothetical protein EA399_16650 [Desulfovibrionales bacterium]|nr:MAG: hypothetical protein EA399_16650 [Desulfovibrionales bacterium]
MNALLLFLLMLFTADGAWADTASEPGDQVIRLGVSTRTFPAANRNDALAALRVWADTVIRERSLQEYVEISLYDSAEALHTAFALGGIDAASLTTEEIMLLGLRPDFIYIPFKDQGFEVRYVLLARRDGVVRDLAGLVAQRLTFFDDSATILAMPWLETLLAEVAGQPIERPLMNLVEVDSPSKAILQVFFRQAQTALVTLEAFELACELNPQLRQELMVLHESQPFVTAFFVFNPDWRGTARDRLEEAIVSLHETPGGQQVLTVFQSARMSRQPSSVLDATRQFLEDYRRLMGDLPARKTPP